MLSTFISQKYIKLNLPKWNATSLLSLVLLLSSLAWWRTSQSIHVSQLETLGLSSSTHPSITSDVSFPHLHLTLSTLCYSSPSCPPLSMTTTVACCMHPTSALGSIHLVARSFFAKCRSTSCLLSTHSCCGRSSSRDVHQALYAFRFPTSNPSPWPLQMLLLLPFAWVIPVGSSPLDLRPLPDASPAPSSFVCSLWSCILFPQSKDGKQIHCGVT